MAFPQTANDLQFGAQNPTGVLLQTNAAGGVQTPGIVAPGTVDVQAPNAGAGTDVSDAGIPLGMNLGTGKLVLGAIGTVGNLWAAWQAQKLAKEQFNYQKGITDTNLANQIQSYNTSLMDRMNSRGFMQGDSQSTIDQYIQENSLRDRRKN